MSDKTHSNAASGQQADTHTNRDRERVGGGTVGVARGSAESGKA